MAKVSRSTVRYAAKQAYQLQLMRGIDESTCVGLFCRVINPDVYVELPNGRIEVVAIAKAWANL